MRQHKQAPLANIEGEGSKPFPAPNFSRCPRSMGSGLLLRNFPNRADQKSREIGHVIIQRRRRTHEFSSISHAIDVGFSFQSDINTFI